jgi:hypothetical protein
MSTAAVPQAGAIPKRDHQRADESSMARATSNENSQQPSTDGLCGVGIILQPMPSGEFKVKGLAPNSPAAACGALQVRDFLTFLF